MTATNTNNPIDCDYDVSFTVHGLEDLWHVCERIVDATSHTRGIELGDELVLHDVNGNRVGTAKAVAQ